MAYEITQVTTIRSTLRISRANADTFRMGDTFFPESAVDMLRRLVFGEDGYAPIRDFKFHGECSGQAYHRGILEHFVAHTEGHADLVFTWVGGETFSGLRIRDGEMREAKAMLTLEPADHEGDCPLERDAGETGSRGLSCTCKWI